MLELMRKYILIKHNLDILENKTRKQTVIRLKCAVMNILYWYFNNTLTSIADQMGYDCHTTVLHHIKDHRARYQHDYAYAEIYDDLKQYAFKNRPDVVNDVDEIVCMLDSIEKELG